MSSPTPNPGIVYLVGAGPGNPGLLTLRGAEVLRGADVVVYDGLANNLLVDMAPPACLRIYAGKKRAADGAPLSQAEINQLLIEHGRAGKRVVRLKGGDPFVYGRGAEECLALHAAGIGFEIVPGVTSATAVSAYAGIPLTARQVASTVALATGHEDGDKSVSSVDWQALAGAGTVVLFMAWRTVAECCARLIDAGRDASTPAAAIYWGTTPAQRTVVATLGDLPAAMEAAQLKPPALLVIGEVVGLRPQLSWYEARPLFGARVLITRSAESSQELAAALAELGAQPIIMPVTRTARPGAVLRPALEQALDRVRSYDWVIFTSANAVTRWFEELAARALDARALGQARIACVGAATARALAAHGVRADVVPASGDGQLLAQELLAAAARLRDAGAATPPAGDVADMRVLFPRAAEGRDDAAVVLREAGAHVDIVPAYITEPMPAGEPATRRGVMQLAAGSVEVIALFAPSQVRALCDLLGADAVERIRGCAVVACIGRTTEAALWAVGVRPHVVASRPDAMVLAAELAAYYQAHGHAARHQAP